MKAAEWLKKNVPLVGGLFGDGMKTSGAAFLAGAGAAIHQTEAPGWAKVLGYALLAGAWAIAGALKKPEAAPAAPPAA